MDRLCDLCGKASAKRKPAPRWGYDGWHCAACRFALQIRRRSCPPRYKLEYEDLQDERNGLALRASEAWRARGFARRTLFEVFYSLLPDRGWFPRHFGATNRDSATPFWMGLLYPELYEHVLALRASLDRSGRARQRADDRIRELEHVETVSKDVHFGIDNPFEDPAFLSKLLEEQDPKAGA